MTAHRGISRLWSDDELDEALSRLHVAAPDDAESLSTARVRLLAAAGGQPIGALPGRSREPSHSSRDHAGPPTIAYPPKRRYRLRIALGAVVAAVLVAVGLLLPTFVTRQNKLGNSAEAIAVLNQAAVGALGATDEPVGPGQYRYIETHVWSTVFGGYDIFRDEQLTRIWVPAQPDDPLEKWMIDRHPTGSRVWIEGSEEQARKDGTFLDPQQTGVTLQATAPCGNFYGSRTCPRTDGLWQDPTPSFLAGLPRDPAELLERLQADAPANGRGPTELLVYAADALRTGLVPADLRAALYQALTRLDSVELTEDAVNLDGLTGSAIGMNDGQIRQDIIIDPASGAFIGDREVTTDDLDDAPAGTTLSYTAVTTAVVDAIGVVPQK